MPKRDTKTMSPRPAAVFVSRGQSTARKLLNDLLAAVAPSLQIVILGLVRAVKEAGGLCIGDATLHLGTHEDESRTFERLNIKFSNVAVSRALHVGKSKPIPIDELLDGIRLVRAQQDNEEEDVYDVDAATERGGDRRAGSEKRMDSTRHRSPAGRKTEYEKQLTTLSSSGWERRDLNVARARKPRYWTCCMSKPRDPTLRAQAVPSDVEAKEPPKVTVKPVLKRGDSTAAQSSAAVQSSTAAKSLRSAVGLVKNKVFKDLQREEDSVISSTLASASGKLSSAEVLTFEMTS